MATKEPSGRSWEIGNDLLGFGVGLDAAGRPRLAKLELRGHRTVDWVPAGNASIINPIVTVGDTTFRCDDGSLSFERAEAATKTHKLDLFYRCANGLAVCHHVQVDTELAAFRTWTTVENTSTSPVTGLKRFDALGLRLASGAGEPEVAYLLGWLDGPRYDAPGHHAAPYPYPSWIPRLLYGDNAPTPPAPPPGGWTTSVLRLVRERLNRLPLRSGKRSTYDNHPWALVADQAHEAGFFAGLEWTGTWAMDLEHFPETSTVSVCARTDASVHDLQPGAHLESPVAFFGLYEGDMEAGFNACRRYSRDRILPHDGQLAFGTEYDWQAGLLLMGTPKPNGLREQVDMAADAGFEVFHVDAMWWGASPIVGDFSIGLGDFSDNKDKFPGGLRALSDHVHKRGMKLGLWFEFERVDIRTAHRGRNPWSPAWLLHQRGHSYRSWCQHVFLLCLGAPEAAAWALENLSWAVREYGVDMFKIDSNEWAVCDDPTHGHGAGDGEWAQVQGLYTVMRGLRERFPHLVIMNCSGGSQRGDPAMARFSGILAPQDTGWPTALVRQYLHGLGCLYPDFHAQTGVGQYPGENGLQSIDPRRLEWRMLGRLPGYFGFGYDLVTLPAEYRKVMLRVLETHRWARGTFLGDRHVLLGPSLLMEPEGREPATWEATEYLSPARDRLSVLVFRCLSPNPEIRLPLKALDPKARYRLTWHSGRAGSTETGAALMTEGLSVRFECTRTGDVAMLERMI
jgi:alpha-galactosidase